jgi:hypothetical protein
LKWRFYIKSKRILDDLYFFERNLIIAFALILINYKMFYKLYSLKKFLEKDKKESLNGILLLPWIFGSSYISSKAFPKILSIIEKEAIL